MWEQLTKAQSEYKSLGLESALDYERFVMISIVYNSTKIEGCSLDEGDTKLLLTEDLTAKGKPLTDHMMVKDHFEAFLHIKEQATRKRALSIDFIKEVNALVKKRTGGIEKTVLGDFDSSKGDLRIAPAYTDTRYFKKHEKIESLLEQLCQKVNDQLDSVYGNDCVALAADIHYHLVDIHPFADGNGRTARLFMNYIQLYHNEPLIKIFTEDRRDYLEALHQTDNTKDINIFRAFVCEQQIKFFKHEVAKYNAMESESGLSM
jgi:Fic family protein